VTPQRARLFVALDLPPAVRAAVAGWGASRVDGLAGARSLAAGSLHATLCFLGSRDVAEVAAIAAEVEAVAAVRRCAGAWGGVELELGRPLWLPRRRPRVLAVDLVDRGDRLGEIQSALAEALAAGGWYDVERRPFLAHVTAARIAKPGLIRGPDLPPPPPLRFPGEAVSLYRSHTTPAGARYEPLATVPLAG
jgi:2'-5' RNA ligase